MQIEDGKGSGSRVEVNSDNQLRVFASVESIDRRQNRVESKVWSLPFEGIDPAGADDYFFYIKNTGTSLLGITDIRIESSVIGAVEVRHVSGTPSYTSDTDVTPVSRNLGSSTTPVATVKTDTDTTGLTNEGVIFYITCDTANKVYHLRTSSNIFIPPGQSVALLWDTSTGILKGMVSLVEVAASRS